MKWFKVFAVAAVLLGVAASASGDSNTYNYQGSGPYFNPKSGQIVDATGNAKIADAFPNRDMNFVFSNIINNSALALNAADSSAVLDVHNMRLGTLLFHVTPNIGSARSRLAVQVRIHLNGGTDSLSVFSVYAYGQGPAQANGTNVDTLEVGHLLAGSTTTPWSGEWLLAVDPLRNSPLNGVVATAFAYPKGIAVPLSSLYGRDFYADYISVRVRNIGGQTAKVAVSLIGSPN